LVSDVNASRKAQIYAAQQDGIGKQPQGFHEFGNARERLDFRGWIPWDEMHSVLCVATAGGQHSALFASLGCRVTVAGSPPLQLELDRVVAHQSGFEIECVDCDMLEIGALLNRSFDLVYQSISAHYVAPVRRVYQGVRKVLRPGGFYWVEHRSPLELQLAAIRAWDGEAYRIAEPQLARPQHPPKPLPWIVPAATSQHTPRVCLQYIHSLHHLIGGFCDSGFTLMGFGERNQGDGDHPAGSAAHRAAYLPPSLVLFGQSAAQAR
jgi:SAM-dependent methyltransferase